MARPNKINPNLFVEYADQGLSNVQISHVFGVSEATVRRGLKKIGYVKADYLLVPDRYEDREQPIQHYGDLIIGSDLHIPLQSNRWCNKLISTARERNITNLAIPGDFTNNDALSVFEPKQANAHLAREVETAKEVMEVFLKTFSTIYLLPGNHDLRIIKSLSWQIEYAYLMETVFGSLGKEFVDKVVVSNLSYMWSEQSFNGYPWYICHPLNYSSQPLGVPRKLANIHSANVIGAHGHHCAAGFAEDGEKIVIESGGLFDKNKIDYIRKPTTSGEWTNGYCYIENGEAKVISDGWSTG